MDRRPAHGSRSHRGIIISVTHVGLSGVKFPDGSLGPFGTQNASTSLPSEVTSLDWLLTPANFLELTGAAYTGQNMANFGLGGTQQGFTAFFVPGTTNVLPNLLPVHARGGWSQLTLRATNRLSFHIMGGIHNSRGRDLTAGNIGHNHSYGANFFYQLAPNVLFSFEALQTRTGFQGTGSQLNNHYDLAFAYLF